METAQPNEANAGVGSTQQDSTYKFFIDIWDAFDKSDHLPAQVKAYRER